MNGGADSALEHVDIQEIEKEKELFKIKGRCHIEISQVSFSVSECLGKHRREINIQ